MDGWKTIFLLGRLAGRCYVSFRECNIYYIFITYIKTYRSQLRVNTPIKNGSYMGMKNWFISHSIHVRYTFIYPHEWLFFMVNYIVGTYTIVPWIAWVSQEKHLTEQKDITTEASKRPSSGERLAAQFVRRPGFEFKEWIVEDLLFFL